MRTNASDFTAREIPGIRYLNSSTIAAKVVEEGENCSCDIILSDEYST